MGFIKSFLYKLVKSNTEFMINDVLSNIDSITPDILYRINVNVLYYGNDRIDSIIRLNSNISDVIQMVKDRLIIPSEEVINKTIGTRSLLDLFTVDNKVVINTDNIDTLLRHRLELEKLNLRHLYPSAIDYDYTSNIIRLYITYVDRIVYHLFKELN